MAIPTRFDPLGLTIEYRPNVKVFEKVGGQVIDTLVLHKGKYKVEMVGAGGGQGGFATNSGIGFGSGGGGSGAAIVFNMKISQTTSFDTYVGNVGSTNRGYLGTGGNGGDSWLRFAGQEGNYIACRGAGTGSGGWSGHGNGGTIQEGSNFLTNVNAQTTLRTNGNRGTDGGVVGGWGTGGNSVYQGYGKGAGGANGDGSSGFIRITYLGAY